MHLFVRKHFSSSFLVESILQFAIIFRKLFAFANVYKLTIISIIIDFFTFSLAVLLAEKNYVNAHWKGFPAFVLPWVYFLPALIQISISAIGGVYKKNSFSILRIPFTFVGNDFSICSNLLFQTSGVQSCSCFNHLCSFHSILFIMADCP